MADDPIERVLGSSTEHLQEKVAQQQENQDERKRRVGLSLSQKLEANKRAARDERNKEKRRPSTASGSSEEEVGRATMTGKKLPLRNPNAPAKISNAQHQKLLNEKQQAADMLHRANQQLKRQQKDLSTQNKLLEQEKKAKAQMQQERDLARTELEDILVKFKAAMDELKKKGKSAQFEQKEDIVKYLFGWVKLVAYRTHKFLETDKKKTTICREAYKVCGLAFNMNLEEDPNFLILEEFRRIYLPVLQEATSKRRQYTQTKLQEKVEIFYKLNDRMPTQDEMNGVYDIPEEEGDERNLACDTLLWYTEHYLQGCAMYEEWNIKISGYFKATDKKPKFDGSPGSEPYITVQMEAFGLFMFENCEERWRNIFLLKKSHNWEKGHIPDFDAEDESTHKYYTAKYCDSKTGKGSGWDPSYGEAYAGYLKRIQDLRKADKKNNYEKYEFAKDLVRVEHNIVADSPKKRRRTSKKKKVTPPPPKIVEEQDSYSVSSDEETVAEEG